jgi:hypothetical protein
MNLPRHAGLAFVLIALNSEPACAASAQWGVSLDAQRSAYGGGAKDTSAGAMGSLHPARSRALTVRFDRRWGRFAAGIGARIVRSAMVVDAEGVYVGLANEFNAVEFMPEVRWRLVRTNRGATVELYGGPLIGVWTFEDFGGRTVPGATAGLQGSFPIFDRVSLSLRIGGSLMRTVFRKGELPQELVIRPMRRSEIALGLRYGH